MTIAPRSRQRGEALPKQPMWEMVQRQSQGRERLARSQTLLTMWQMHHSIPNLQGSTYPAEPCP